MECPLDATEKKKHKINLQFMQQNNLTTGYSHFCTGCLREETDGRSDNYEEYWKSLRS